MQNSIHRSMVQSNTEPLSDITPIVYDGNQLQPITQVSDRTQAVSVNVRVVDIRYDASIGLLQVIKSDGSIKTIKGFITPISIEKALMFNKNAHAYRGDKGLPGIDGLSGRDGRPGSPGCPGVRGDRGLTGLRGADGKQGEQGDRGDKGREGRPGIQGNRGFDGDIGVVGLRGFIGPQGKAGHIGNKGVKGDRGDTGPQGPMGCIGYTGPDGKRGDRGDKGLDGLTGDPGGFGPSGPDGHRGQDGVDGVPGNVIDIVAGDNVEVSWIADKDGNKVIKSIKALDCRGCCDSPPETTPNPSETTTTTTTTSTTATAGYTCTKGAPLGTIHTYMAPVATMLDGKRGDAGCFVWDVSEIKPGEKIEMEISGQYRNGLRADWGITMDGKKFGSQAMENHVWTITLPSSLLIPCFEVCVLVSVGTPSEYPAVGTPMGSIVVRKPK